MRRSTVRKVFVTGLVVWVVGGVLLLLSVQSGQGAGTSQYEAGLLLAAIGAVMGVVSWLMALIASAVLGRWGWFAVVLILGLVGLLLPVMILYSIVGPTQGRQPRRPVVAT